MIAFLLGATDINPPAAHYYCPRCKSVRFVPDMHSGWEMASVPSMLRQHNLTETGFACRIMENARKGVYTRNPLPDAYGRTPEAIGAEAWFIEGIQKSRYLFAKPDGIALLKLALITAWCNRHCRDAASGYKKSRAT